jgi:acetyl-CoA carboxylase carboxyl transferase subunit alpha
MEYIPFEKPIADLETKIDELRRMASAQAINLDKEIFELERSAGTLRDRMFANLTVYETTQICRHPRRPNSLDLIGFMCSEFIELHGDRNFFDDKAIVGGLAVLDGRSIIVIGHQKGRGTKGNIERNFGMPKPEGYRKALRLMSMAERFRLPILTLIDTPGAYPGIGAEERGQSEAIGKNIMVMSRLGVPIVTVVIGEGGSGGALALGVGNCVHMLQYSTYSVISPEGCASILFKDAGQAAHAAEALKISAQSAMGLGVIDSIIPEPKGGAHRGPQMIANEIKLTVLKDFEALSKLNPKELRKHRTDKFLAMGDVRSD